MKNGLVACWPSNTFVVGRQWEFPPFELFFSFIFFLLARETIQKILLKSADVLCVAPFKVQRHLSLFRKITKIDL